MSNGSIRVKVKNEAVSIITHDCDLANLFPDTHLLTIIRVNLGGDVIPDYSCVVSFLGVNSESSQTSRTDLFSTAVKGP